MKVLCIEESTSIILIIVLPRFSKLEISTDNLGLSFGGFHSTIIISVSRLNLFSCLNLK